MQPIQITQVGTGASTPFIPDTKQNPFNMGIGVNISVGTAFWAIEHCFDFTTVMSPTWGGTTGVTWFVNSGLSGGTTAGQGTTTVSLNGNYAFAVAAIRLNVYSSGATGQVVANFLQSVNSP